MELGKNRSVCIDKDIQTDTYLTMYSLCISWVVQNYLRLWLWSNIPQPYNRRSWRRGNSTQSSHKWNNAHDIGVQQYRIRRVLYEQFLHSYNFQQVQTLVPGDDFQCIDFVYWFLQRSAVQTDFPSCILFTDKATFSQKGVVYAHKRYFFGPWESKSYMGACSTTMVQRKSMGGHRRALPSWAIPSSLKTRWP